LKETDVDDLFEFTSDERVTAHMTWDTHLEKDATIDFIHFIMEQYEYGESADLGIIYAGKLIGICAFIDWNETDRSAEVGYLLNHSFWGKGFMVEAMQAMLHYGFTVKGFNRIEARCNDDNANSERVMQKLGMQYEGTLRKDKYIKGKYRNTKIYSILSEEYLTRD